VDERENIRSTAGDDATTESAALQLVLALHPSALSFEELVRELGDDRDTVERAVTELAGAGLLHRREAFVVPTRAALRFDELMER
jgi:predicted transcriptional regulator